MPQKSLGAITCWSQQGGRTRPAPLLRQATTAFGWSRNVLLNQIKARAYEQSLAEGKSHNFPLALTDHLAEQAEEALKSSYNLEFLGIRRPSRDANLKTS